MMSWISLADLVRVYEAIISEDHFQGPLNAVAPSAVSNRAFTEALGTTIRRPTVLPMPSWLVRALFGRMAEETLLADLNVQPSCLEAVGFQWTVRTSKRRSLVF